MRQQSQQEFEEAAANRTREQHEQDLSDRRDELAQNPQNRNTSTTPSEQNNTTGNNPKQWDDPRDMTEGDRANGRTVTNADGTVSEGVGTTPRNDNGINPNDPNNPTTPQNPNQPTGPIDPNNPNWDPNAPQTPNPNPNPFDPSQVTPNPSGQNPTPQGPRDEQPQQPHPTEPTTPTIPTTPPDRPTQNEPEKPTQDNPTHSDTTKGEETKLPEGNKGPIDFNPEKPAEPKPEKAPETIPEPPQDKTERKPEIDVTPRTNAEQVAADLAMMEMLEGALMSQRQQSRHTDVIEQMSDNKNEQDYSHMLDPLVTKASDSMAMVQDVMADYIQPIVDQPEKMEEPIAQENNQVLDLVGQGLEQILHSTQVTPEPQAEPIITPEQMDIANIVAGLTSGRLVADPNSLNIDEQFDDMGAKIVQAMTQNDFNQALSGFGVDNTAAFSTNPIDMITNALSNGPTDQSDADLLASIDPTQMDLGNPLVSEWDPEVMAKKYREMLDERREQDDKERREREEAQREEEAKRYAAAMLAALKARQHQEEANRIKAQKDLLNLETRQKYVVLPGDTLESIAQKKLMNRRLCALLYEINRSRIPIVARDGKKLLQLKPRIVLFLPTQMEIKRFNSRLFGKSAEKFEYDTECSDKNTPRSNPGLIVSGSKLSNKTNSPADTTDSTSENGVETKDNVVPLNAKRKANIEALLGKMSETAPDDGRIRYVCRLGDTLRSVAMRHPALKDVALWRLVAEINNISADTDRKGVPLAELKRGQTIVLPLPHEIADFREKQKTSSAPVVTAAKAPASEVSKQCPGCRRLVLGSPNNCAACDHSFIETVKSESKAYINTPDQQEETIDVEVAAQNAPEYSTGQNLKYTQRDEAQDATTSLLMAAGFKPIDSQARTGTDNADVRTQRNVITVVSDDCRIVSFGNQEESSSGFRARLEYKQGEFWLPVILYEINEGTSWRHEYNLNGGRKSTRIELPPSQAKQLASNDLGKNWDNYLKKFLRV